MAVESSGQSMGTPPSQRETTAHDEQALVSAMAVAQLGGLTGATQVLNELRSKYADKNFPRISIRVMLLEAVILYYRDRGPISLDRAKRANVLAVAFGLVDLRAESAVWVSHFSFNFEDYLSLKSAIQSAFEGFELLSNSAKARLCLIAADSNQFIGSPSDATRWYALARMYSRLAHDRAIVAAIEYNRAVMALSRLRVERFISAEISAGLRKSWLAEVLSIRRLHQGLGATALNELLLLCESFAYQFDEKYSLAIEPLTAICESGGSGACGMNDRQLALEIEWCRVLSGQAEEDLHIRLPTLDELSEWSGGAQAIGLSQMRDISARLGLPCNTLRLQGMLKDAIYKCNIGDQRLREVIEVCRQFMSSIEILSGIGNSDPLK